MERLSAGTEEAKNASQNNPVPQVNQAPQINHAPQSNPLFSVAYAGSNAPQPVFTTSVRGLTAREYARHFGYLSTPSAVSFVAIYDVPSHFEPGPQLNGRIRRSGVPEVLPIDPLAMRELAERGA